MNFVKKNKGTIIAVGIFLIVLIFLIQIKNIFFPNEKKAIYGNRLEGIEEVKITDASKKSVKDALKDTTSNVNVRTAGRIINITITANNDVSVDTAKSLADKAINEFSAAEKKYYDFQVFIQKSIDSAEFPIIGYKHHTKESFTWTKDRTGTE